MGKGKSTGTNYPKLRFSKPTSNCKTKTNGTPIKVTSKVALEVKPSGNSEYHSSVKEFLRLLDVAKYMRSESFQDGATSTVFDYTRVYRSIVSTFKGSPVLPMMFYYFIDMVKTHKSTAQWSFNMISDLIYGCSDNTVLPLILDAVMISEKSTIDLAKAIFTPYYLTKDTDEERKMKDISLVGVVDMVVNSTKYSSELKRTFTQQMIKRANSYDFAMARPRLFIKTLMFDMTTLSKLLKVSVKQNSTPAEIAQASKKVARLVSKLLSWISANPEEDRSTLKEVTHMCLGVERVQPLYILLDHKSQYSDAIMDELLLSECKYLQLWIESRSETEDKEPAHYPDINIILETIPDDQLTYSLLKRVHLLFTKGLSCIGYNHYRKLVDKVLNSIEKSIDKDHLTRLGVTSLEYLLQEQPSIATQLSALKGIDLKDLVYHPRSIAQMI